MAPAFVSEADDGFAKVTIGGMTKDIDLGKVWSELDEIRHRTNGLPPSEYWEAIVLMLCDLGFPRVSYLKANEFAKWHSGVVAELGKAAPGAPTPGSPGSTESPSSTSPPE